MSEKYLLDTNVFIDPFRRYYSFDLAPQFWKQLETSLTHSDVFIIDMVYDEICRLEDDLKKWLKGSKVKKFSCRTGVVMQKAGEVLNYIHDCGFYTSEALRTWSDPSCADPWLIGAAMTLPEAVIITFEHLFYFMRKKKIAL